MLVSAIISCNFWLAQYASLKKVKVSHSLIVVGAVGVRVPLYLGHS